MDYSKLSDFEIDKAVADVLGFDYDIAIMFVSPVDKINGNHVEEYVRKKITSNEKHWKRFSPSRIPNDSWSIIESNGIGMRKQSNGLWCATRMGGAYPIYDDKPLRAAMILFLMMQEPK
ncbi:TPA: phage protein NinX family protein [Klebsiella aerogenes]